jgi:hypothetical protein
VGAPARHRLIATTAWLLPLAVAVALLGVAATHALAARLVACWFALLGVAAWLWQRRQRPVLLLDDDGWAIEQRGREKLRVHWSEVQKVRLDRGEHALYVDCGEVGRNLLVPPRRGFGFRFADQEALCARVLASVPAGCVQEVERLERDGSDGGGARSDGNRGRGDGDGGGSGPQER